MLEVDGTIYDQTVADFEVTGYDFSEAFVSITDFRQTIPGTFSDADGIGRFEPRQDTGTTPPNMEITLETFAFVEPDLANVVFLKYTLTNNEDVPLEDVYLGLFNVWALIWDGLPDIDNLANKTGFSAEDSLMYVYDTASAAVPAPHVAVAGLSPHSSLFAIDFNDSGVGLMMGITDGFTDDEKRLALRAGFDKPVEEGPTGEGAFIVTVIGSGPYQIPAGEDLVVGFV